MRTVKTTLTKEEKVNLSGVIKESKLVGQDDVAEDIYGFFKNPEIISEADLTDDLIHEFCKGKFEYYLPAKKKIQGRIEFFSRIINHPYYDKFKNLPPNQSALTLLNMLNAFKKAKEEPDGGDDKKEEQSELEREFESIIKYGMELFDLLDDPYFKRMMEYKGISTKVEKAGDLQKQAEQVSSIMGHELAIYDLSQKLQFTIRLSKTGKYEESHFPDNGLDVARIRHIPDMIRALPTQLALDDDVFLKKLVSKELLMRKYMARKEKRQILYVLVDKSGSMGADLYQVRNQNLTRMDVSKAVCIALMKKLIENEDYFCLRWFDDGVYDTIKVKTENEAINATPKIIYGTSSGGGTNIMYALEVAVKDMKSAEFRNMDMSDILLISDGDATVDHIKVNKMMDNKINLHTAFINEYDFSRQLKAGKTHPYSSLIMSCKNFLQARVKEGADVLAITNLLGGN